MEGAGGRAIRFEFPAAVAYALALQVAVAHIRTPDPHEVMYIAAK